MRYRCELAIMRSLLVLFWLVLFSFPTVAETSRMERDDGTLIVYHVARPQNETFPLVVILQGSECLRVSDKYSELVNRLNTSGVAVLRVEKPGLGPDTPVGDCPEEYLRLNTIDRRVLDLLAVVAKLRREESGWDGRLGLSGGSEGAMVAALSAPLLPETVAVLLLSSGGGSNFGEEVKASIAAHMRTSGATEEQVSERMASVSREWDEIARLPISSKEWASDGKLARNTYLWWSQALPKAVYRPLLEITVPIRVYQGRADTSMPESTSQRLRQRFQEAGKSNLELVEYDGEHVPPPEVLEKAFGWLTSKL